MGRWRQRLTEGVSTIIVTTANHITFLVLHERDWSGSVLGYLHKTIWLADACIDTWKVEKNSTSATINASEVTWWSHNSVRQHLTLKYVSCTYIPFKLNVMGWHRCPVWMGRNNNKPKMFLPFFHLHLCQIQNPHNKKYVSKYTKNKQINK